MMACPVSERMRLNQLVLAALWFRRFRYGPLEWLWRAATRTTLAVPFRA